MSADRTEPGGAGARSMERHLGNAIRAHRYKNHLTIGEVAAQAGISQGMLSKIENGQAAMSLDTLGRVARALGVPVGDLFRAYDLPAGGARLVRSDEGMEVVRGGTQRGYTYNLLAYDKGPRRSFEPFLVTMNDETEVFPSFEHPGIEFIHLLQGRIEYRHGQHTYLLEPGDSLTFRGDIPHGPERLIEVPIRLLSMIVYGPGELE
jgi:transcriptional regulator with XRE-family HTH domain